MVGMAGPSSRWAPELPNRAVTRTLRARALSQGRQHALGVLSAPCRCRVIHASVEGANGCASRHDRSGVIALRLPELKKRLRRMRNVGEAAPAMIFEHARCLHPGLGILLGSAIRDRARW